VVAGESSKRAVLNLYDGDLVTKLSTIDKAVLPGVGWGSRCGVDGAADIFDPARVFKGEASGERVGKEVGDRLLRSSSSEGRLRSVPTASALRRWRTVADCRGAVELVDDALDSCEASRAGPSCSMVAM